MFDSLEVQVPLHKPDRREVIAKRKGVAARRGLKESAEQTCEPMIAGGEWATTPPCADSAIFFVVRTAQLARVPCFLLGTFDAKQRAERRYTGNFVAGDFLWRYGLPW